MNRPPDLAESYIADALEGVDDEASADACAEVSVILASSAPDLAVCHLQAAALIAAFEGREIPARVLGAAARSVDTLFAVNRLTRDLQ